MNHRIYVTDASGKVLLDSAGVAVGQDYSRWNDVHLTSGDSTARAPAAKTRTTRILGDVRVADQDGGWWVKRRTKTKVTQTLDKVTVVANR